MTILVTGATGQLGGLILQKLVDRGVPAGEIVAGGRDSQRLADLSNLGFVTMPLDYDDAASIVSALAGVDTVMLVSGADVGRRVGQHGAVIEAAEAAGATRLVYTSVSNAEVDHALAPEHRGTEQLIRSSRLGWTLLRNNFYSENYVARAERAQQQGVLLTATGDGRVSSATRDDMAEGAAVVLTTEGHEGETYDFAGDEAWSMDELAEHASDVFGSPIERRDLPGDEFRRALVDAGMSDGGAAFTAQLDDDIRRGCLHVDSPDLSRLLGRPTTPIRELLRVALTPPPPPAG